MKGGGGAALRSRAAKSTLRPQLVAKGIGLRRPRAPKAPEDYPPPQRARRGQRGGVPSWLPEANGPIVPQRGMSFQAGPQSREALCVPWDPSYCFRRALGMLDPAEPGSPTCAAQGGWVHPSHAAHWGCPCPSSHGVARQHFFVTRRLHSPGPFVPGWGQPKAPGAPGTLSCTPILQYYSDPCRTGTDAQACNPSLCEALSPPTPPTGAFALVHAPQHDSTRQVHAARHALEAKGPQRHPQKRFDRGLEEVAIAVGGGYCRLQMLTEATDRGEFSERPGHPRPWIGGGGG